VAEHAGPAQAAATDEQKAQVLPQVRRRFQHLLAERLLSGMGLPVLHQTLCAVAGTAGQNLTAVITDTLVALTGSMAWMKRAAD
jgi:glucokinase